MIANPLEVEFGRGKKTPLRRSGSPVVSYSTQFCGYEVRGRSSPRDTHRKRYLLRPGAIYAEVLLVRLLRDAGWKAVWIDTFRDKIWDDMPSTGREAGLPKSELDLYCRIRRANRWERGGCWDIWAWHEGSMARLFVEAKRKDDEVGVKQVKWFESAKSARVPARQFCIVEWTLNTIDSSARHPRS